MTRWKLQNNMKVERARRNLTQEQLAEMVGVTRKTINTIERCVFVPSTLLALRIAQALQIEFKDLFYMEKE
jgi:putative transcriptional regulator